jgi:hypothetical protein
VRRGRACAARLIDPQLPASRSAPWRWIRAAARRLRRQLETFAKRRAAPGRVAGARELPAASSWTLNVPVEIRRDIDVLVLRRAVGAARRSAPPTSCADSVNAGLASPFVPRSEDLAGGLTAAPASGRHAGDRRSPVRRTPY